MIKKLLGSKAFWLFAFISLCAFLIGHWVHQMGGPAALQQRYGLLAPIVSAGILVVLTPAPFPGDLLAIANGSLYGFINAVVINWSALWLAAMIEARIGQRFGVEFELQKHREKLPKFLRALPIEHPVFLILARQLPVVGTELSTLLPGSLGVPLKRIAWCSALGILPGAVLFAALGAGILSF